MQLSDKFFTFDTGEKSHFFDIITSSGLSLSLFSIGASIQKIAFKGKKWSDHPETDGNELPITLSSGNPDFYTDLPADCTELWHERHPVWCNVNFQYVPWKYHTAGRLRTFCRMRYRTCID